MLYVITWLEKELPLLQGYVGDTLAIALRDTRFNSAAVKEDLIDESQLNGKRCSCVLIGGTIRRFLLATIEVDTPYYTGRVNAMVAKPHP